MDCTKDTSITFDQTVKNLCMAESIYDKSSKFCNRDCKKINRVGQEDTDPRVDVCAARIMDVIDTDAGQASIKTFLATSSTHHVPHSIWTRLDKVTRGKILEIKWELAREERKGSSDVKPPATPKEGKLPTQYSKANLASTGETDQEDTEVDIVPPKATEDDMDLITGLIQDDEETLV